MVGDFIFLQTSFVVFLSIFSYFVLTELAPVSSVSDVTVWEWVVYVWVASLVLQEFQQVCTKALLT